MGDRHRRRNRRRPSHDQRVSRPARRICPSGIHTGCRRVLPSELRRPEPDDPFPQELGDRRRTSLCRLLRCRPAEPGQPPARELKSSTNSTPQRTERPSMRNKIALEEHFATDLTIDQSKAYAPPEFWPRLKSNLLDIEQQRLERMEEGGTS